MASETCSTKRLKVPSTTTTTTTKAGDGNEQRSQLGKRERKRRKTKQTKKKTEGDNGPATGLHACNCEATLLAGCDATRADDGADGDADRAYTGAGQCDRMLGSKALSSLASSKRAPTMESEAPGWH